MRILHVINNLNAGGAEKLLTDILPIMKEKGHEVAVAISNGGANVDKYERIMETADIPVIDYKTSFYNPFIAFKLLRTIKGGKYDIVHAHLFPSQYWLAFASLWLPKRIQLIKTEHSVFNERKQYKILKPLEKFVYGRYSRLIAITQLVKENLASWLNTHEIVVIHNGVNLKQIEQAKQQPVGDVFTAEDYSILMTSRFDGIHKDQISLIEAIVPIADVQLYFAGAGPALEKTREFANSLGLASRVHFLGMRTDVYALMAQVDLNVLSTNTEGLSGVALESLASGKPFIGSDVEGVKDVVPDASFLFPKQNPTELTEKILMVKNDSNLAQTLVNKALIHVMKFDIDTMVDGYLTVYEDTLKQSLR